MELYHYYDLRSGPFRSLTALPEDEARAVFDEVRRSRPASMGAQRDDDYLRRRRRCEALVREAFIAAGGAPVLTSPYYMVVGHSPWLSTWYEQGGVLKIPVEEFPAGTVSFTYGDSMPCFNPNINIGKEYQCRIYTYPDILGVIEKYGLPQDRNDDGHAGPERYIEAQIWSDEVVARYRK